VAGFTPYLLLSALETVAYEKPVSFAMSLMVGAMIVFSVMFDI
jgi:hypothetical protein